MREVAVVVRVQVDADEVFTEVSQEVAEAAACEAVKNAVECAEQDGFLHRYADTVSIGVVDVSVARFGIVDDLDSAERADLNRQLKKFSPPEDAAEEQRRDEKRGLYPEHEDPAN